MATSPQISPGPNPPGGYTRGASFPKRIAVAVCDWTRSAIIVIASAVALCGILTVAYLAIRALLALVDLVERGILPRSLS